MSKIYTKTGDKGKTSLMGGKRVLKSDIRVEAYGTVDELNSVLGVVLSQLHVSHVELHRFMESLQHDLFDIGSYLSDPSATAIEGLSKKITKCEQLIDEQTKNVPALRNFILPGGGVSGAGFHHARTVSRRAERRIVELAQNHAIDGEVIRYINRLSDLFFSTARYVSHVEKKKETQWKKTTTTR